MVSDACVDKGQHRHEANDGCQSKTAALHAQNCITSVRMRHPQNSKGNNDIDTKWRIQQECRQYTGRHFPESGEKLLRSDGARCSIEQPHSEAAKEYSWRAILRQEKKLRRHRHEDRCNKRNVPRKPGAK